MRLRVGIAATALALMAAAGCAVQPASTVPATIDSPSVLGTSSSTSATTESGVLLSKARIGALRIGESTQDEAVEYLTAAFDKAPQRLETTCEGPLGSGSYTPLSWDGLEIEINDQGILASWSVTPADAPEGLRLESGLPFDATFAEVQAAAPADKARTGDYLLESDLTDWALKDSAADTTFYWRAAGDDEPAANTKAVWVTGPTWDKCLGYDG